MKTITKSALMLFSIGVLTACGAQETPTTSGSEPVESEEPGTSVISSEPSSVEIDDYAYGKYVVTDFETERQVAYYDSDDATLSLEATNTFEEGTGALRINPGEITNTIYLAGSPNIKALADYAVLGARAYVEDATAESAEYTYSNFLNAELYHGETLVDSYKIVRANTWIDIAFNLTSVADASLDDGAFKIVLTKYVHGVDEEENDIVIPDSEAPQWKLLLDDVYVSPLDSKIENADTFGNYVDHDFDSTGKTIYDSEDGWGGFDGFKICYGHGFVDDYERFVHTSDVTDYTDFMGPGTRQFAGAYACALGQTWRWASYQNDAFIIDVVATKKISLQLVTSDLIAGWATTGDTSADINNTFYVKRAEDTLPTTLAKRDNSSKKHYQFAEIELDVGDHFFWHFISSASDIIILECLWNYRIGTLAA